MAWYDGMTMEEVDRKLQAGEIEGCKVPGGVIEVPSGYLEWSCNQLAEARYRADPDCLGLWRQDMERAAQAEARQMVSEERERCAEVCEEFAAEAQKHDNAMALWFRQASARIRRG